MWTQLNLAQSLLAQQYSSNSNSGIAETIITLAIIVIYFALTIFTCAGMWKMFTKAGRAGWTCLIPIYNLYILLKITGRPGWLIIGYFVPIVNAILYVVLCYDLARSFGRSIGTTLGLFFLSPIFIIILGFGSAEYQGPAAAQG